MKKFYVIILCVCFVQICFGSENATDNSFDVDQIKQELRSKVHGVSEEFVDDFVFSLKALDDHKELQNALIGPFIRTLSKQIPNEEHGKIDVKSVKDYIHRKQSNPNNGWTIPETIDSLKIIQSILAKNAPSGRLNNMVNLLFALEYPNATSEEVESALGYLYGTETTGPKLTLLNIPSPTAADCPDQFEAYSKPIDKLKTMADIKPKVIEDVIAIRDKFPCIDVLLTILNRFASLMKQLGGDQSKIDVCTVEKRLIHLERKSNDPNIENVYILPTRLPDETFRGILNFIKATDFGAPIDEIQKALEYLYDDVSATKCP